MAGAGQKYAITVFFQLCTASGRGLGEALSPYRQYKARQRSACSGPGPAVLQKPLLHRFCAATRLPPEKPDIVTVASQAVCQALRFTSR